MLPIESKFILYNTLETSQWHEKKMTEFVCGREIQIKL